MSQYGRVDRRFSAAVVYWGTGNSFAVVFIHTILVSLAVMCLATTLARAQFDRPIALSARVVGGEDTSRVILDFDREATATPQLLEHPWRLVLDFEKIGFGMQPKPDGWTGFAKDIRWGDMSETNSRIIFEMRKPFSITAIEQIENGETDTHRLIIDLKLSDPRTFRAAMLDRMKTSAIVQRSSKSDRLGAATDMSKRNDRFLVVIDPGHGGIDSGAVGRKHTLEKEITLAFSKQLKEELTTRYGIEAILTREEDVFVPLAERVTIARQNEASLFVSVHADSIREKYVRGATVYTISDKASDNVSERIAASENSADEIAGINFKDEEEDVVDILVDLARRETLGFSVKFARLAVEKLSKTTRMIKNPHRHAGFRVLRAPDVPSVLIELGYLSNIEDEKQLKQVGWRARMAEQIALAIDKFARISGHEIAERENAG